jgi:hypothetical protein
MDPAFVATIARSTKPQEDLENIVTAALGQIDVAGGRWGVATLLATAVDVAGESQGAEGLQRLREQLIPSPGRIDFALAAALLPVPTEQYVTSPCEVEAAVGTSGGAPTSEDRAYLRAVRQVYSVWRDEPEYQYISGTLTPRPAGLVANDVIRREMPAGAGSTVQFWSWCKTNHTLMDNQRLLILGRPGIGKTSLIRFLARRYTVGDGRILPIIVSLRSWRDEPGTPRTLVQFIQDFLRNPPDRRVYPDGAALADTLPRYLTDPGQQARLVFLLDDYNRMARDDPADYARRWQAIRTFANQYPDVTIAVISRLLDYDGQLAGCTPDFEIVELNRWGPAQITEYLRRNAPRLLPLAEERWFVDLADVPVQLAQMVEVLAPGPEADAKPVVERVFQNAHQVLAAFVDRLFTFSEQMGRGDRALRARAEQWLRRFAAGLRQDQRSGGYVEYTQAMAYFSADDPPAERERVLATALDATILDMILGVKQVGFEAQQLEDYFATADGADPYAAVTAQLSSAQPDAALRATEAADQAGLLRDDGRTT